MFQGDVLVLHPSTDIILNANSFYAADQRTVNLKHLLRAVYNLLSEGATVPIPISSASENQGQIVLVTHTASDNLVYVAAFSSVDALDNIGLNNLQYTIIERPLVNYFEAVLQMEGIAGIVFNPTSPFPFTMKKQIIHELLSQLVKQPPKNSLSVLCGDITELACDAIVNAANASLLGGGGVDGAIHKAAGSKLLEECKLLHGCATGEAKITFGYDLPVAYVIHTVGPIYNGKVSQRLELADCYRNSLNLGKKYHLHSIAFAAISTGVYGYPIDEACRIALLTVTEWLNANPDYGMEVTMVCFNSAVYDAYTNIVEAAKRGELE